MDLIIVTNTDKNSATKAFELRADSYEYKCMPDFKELGNGFLDVDKCYPTTTAIEYESELLRTGIPNHKALVTRPYRFWTGKRHTKVWQVENGVKEPIDIHELRLIGDQYHIMHVHVQLVKYKLNITQSEQFDRYRLAVRNIYLEEN